VAADDLGPYLAAEWGWQAVEQMVPGRTSGLRSGHNEPPASLQAGRRGGGGSATIPDEKFILEVRFPDDNGEGSHEPKFFHFFGFCVAQLTERTSKPI
jgi:hypothetical protein